MTTSSPMERFSKLLTGLFGGKRNLAETFGYRTEITYADFMHKYLRQGVASRIVDAPAQALWTNPPQITANDPLWNTAWSDLVSKFNLFSVIERADKLAGIGRFSVILIGFNDGAKLEQPVNTANLARKIQKILFLQPYGENSAKIDTLNSDIKSENFGKPEFYSIRPTQELSSVSTTSTRNVAVGTIKVHASRIVHIAENTLEGELYGSPRLERVFNTLDDLEKVVGGSAETYWLTANRGMHVDVDKEIELSDQDAKDLSAEVDEYHHQLRRVIRTRGAKINSLGSDTPDPTGTFNTLIAILSGSTGIPRRILTGSEAGQLASNQDRANWADRITERRKDFGTPIVLFKLLKILTRAQYLPTSETLEITIDWPTAYTMSPLEQAQTSAQHARSATNFAKAIDTMNRVKAGTPQKLDAEGNPIEGTGTKALKIGDLVTIDEARKFIGLDKPTVVYDSSSDIT